jgi:hypothetical protein
MADPYNLSLTASQIDTALLAASDSDKAPASGATNLVNSNRIYQAIQAEASARTSADSALDSRVTALEAAKASNQYIVYSLPDQTFSSTKNPLTGWTEVQDPDGRCSESSGIFTLSAGTYLITFSARMRDTDTGSDQFDIFLESGGPPWNILDSADLQNVDHPITMSAAFAADGVDTFKINLREAVPNTTLVSSNIRIIIIPLT